VVSNLIKEPRDRWWDDATTKDKIETRATHPARGVTELARKSRPSGRDTDAWQ
jgi:hypothetical protein